MATRKMKVRTAFDESVEAAPWVEDHHAALVLVGRRLADAIDQTEGASEYGSLSRLSLEFRQVLRGLGLYVGDEPAQSGEVVTMDVLDKIRAV